MIEDFTFTFHFHAMKKEMATHSSVLAWRIRGTSIPGGLPSTGSHRVGYDWSDLAAAAAAASVSAKDVKGIYLEHLSWCFLFSHISPVTSIFSSFYHPCSLTSKSQNTTTICLSSHCLICGLVLHSGKVIHRWISSNVIVFFRGSDLFQSLPTITEKNKSISKIDLFL